MTLPASACLLLVLLALPPAFALETLHPRSLQLLLTSFSVSPTTLTFVANNPDSSPAAATSTATFVNGVGVGSNAWTLTAAAASSTLTNCPNIPLSALKLTCSSITVTGIAGYTAVCSGAVALSTTPQTIASGQDGPIASALVTHTVSTAVNFNDSWKFPASGASSCSVSMTYTISRN